MLFFSSCLHHEDHGTAAALPNPLLARACAVESGQGDTPELRGETDLFVLVVLAFHSLGKAVLYLAGVGGASERGISG